MIYLKTKTFLFCGAIACPIFFITALIGGAARTGYNSFLYPISSLLIGDLGWIQIINFIFTGILLLFFSYGMKKVFSSASVKFRAPLLIGLVGIGLTGAGIFSTDPVFGYPTYRPLVLRQFTLHGH